MERCWKATEVLKGKGKDKNMTLKGEEDELKGDGEALTF